MSPESKEIEIDMPIAMKFNPLNKGSLRNIPCPCGSGKKVKKCHGIKTAVTYNEYNEIVNWINQFNVKFKTAFAEQAQKSMDAMNEQKQETKDTK